MQAIKEAERTRESHELRERPMSTAMRRSEMLGGGGFLLCAAALALFGGVGHVSTLTAAIYVIGIAVASNVRFDVGAGFTVPTQAVFVPMLFAVPVAAVPLLTVVRAGARHGAEGPSRRHLAELAADGGEQQLVLAGPGARAGARRRSQRPDGHARRAAASRWRRSSRSTSSRRAVRDWSLGELVAARAGSGGGADLRDRRRAVVPRPRRRVRGARARRVARAC